MHLRRRWVVVTAAWATPLAWITITLFSGPSDGTVVSVADGLGRHGPLGRGGYQLRRVDGGHLALRTGDLHPVGRRRSTADATAEDAAPAGSVGDFLVYSVLRPHKLDRTLGDRGDPPPPSVASAASAQPGDGAAGDRAAGGGDQRRLATN